MKKESRVMSRIRAKKSLNGSGSGSFTFKQAHRGKRALLCCISYKKQRWELRGSSKDLKNVRDLLLHHFAFSSDSILILAEKEPYLTPTKKNIEEGFKWLMKDIQPGDSLLFYFSGHGKYQQCFQGDEIDGFDEAICPLDFESNGMIFDNYINKTIVKPLIPGVTLHAFIDCCHSGTVLDLSHVYNVNTGKWEDNRAVSGEFKGTSGGMAICISACEDHQLAADKSGLSGDENDTNGAMTWSFIKAVKEAAINNRKLTYSGILNHMQQSLRREAQDKGGCIGGGLRRVLCRRILQDPLLSSSQEFNTDAEFKL